jgi:hypothetical protein
LNDCGKLLGGDAEDGIVLRNDAAEREAEMYFDHATLLDQVAE